LSLYVTVRMAQRHLGCHPVGRGCSMNTILGRYQAPLKLDRPLEMLHSHRCPVNSPVGSYPPPQDLETYHWQPARSSGAVIRTTPNSHHSASRGRHQDTRVHLRGSTHTIAPSESQYSSKKRSRKLAALILMARTLADRDGNHPPPCAILLHLQSGKNDRNTERRWLRTISDASF
jgi:hypothetical protein